MAEKKKKSNNSLAKIAATPRLAWKYVLESRDELKKVAWPNRETTTRYTVLVVIASLVVGFVIGGIDFLFTKVLERVI